MADIEGILVTQRVDTKRGAVRSIAWLGALEWPPLRILLIIARNQATQLAEVAVGSPTDLLPSPLECGPPDIRADAVTPKFPGLTGDATTLAKEHLFIREVEVVVELIEGSFVLLLAKLLSQ